MKKLIPLVAFVLISFTAGCPKTTGPTPTPAPPIYQPVVNGVIDCLNAEKAVLQKDVPVLQIAMDVVGALIQAATTKDFSAAVKDLIAKYTPVAGDATESIVACAVTKAEAAISAWSAGNGSAAGSGMMAKAPAPDKKAMVDAVVAEHGWKFAPAH